MPLDQRAIKAGRPVDFGARFAAMSGNAPEYFAFAVMDVTLTPEAEIAGLIIATLNLEIDPAELDPEQPLFGEGLGLDSIDALELALAISQRYGITLTSEAAREQRVFASVRSLARFIGENRTI